ncbi:MAG: choice-of-anchor L domain-containing protein [Bacteroidales bacterium]|nr:choice-of-anchor L domain-containing protein [Bacteroidales bacterium]
MKNIFLTLALSFLPFLHFGQALYVNPFQYTPQSLVENYLGTDDVQILNVNYIGDPKSKGYFKNLFAPANFPFSSGFILSNGSWFNVVGPNNSGSKSANISGVSDSLLETFLPVIVTDVSRLDFSFVSNSTTFSFFYIFGSEEYPEFVNSSYYDVFGIFITGPDPMGGNYLDKNIALVPGTNYPINIQTININQNSGLFIDNGNGTTPANEATQFDGYTVPLEASFSIIPGATYTVKIIIGDSGDPSWDSGLFITSKDYLSRNFYSLELESAYGTGLEIFEGHDANLIISRDCADTSNDILVEFNYSGTAIPGVDLNFIGLSQTIPAGQQYISIPITVIDDGISENLETFIINSEIYCTNCENGFTIEVYDEFVFEGGILEDTIRLCNQALTINTFANTEDSLVDYEWSTGEITPSISFTNSDSYTETFYVTMTSVEGQSIIDSVLVVSSSEIICAGSVHENACNLGSVFLYTFGGIPPYSYIWNTGSIQQNLIAIAPGIYTVTVHDSNNCFYIEEVQLFSNPPLESDIFAWSNCTDSTGIIFVNAAYGNPPYSYLWSNGEITESIIDAIPGNYFLTITDLNGCTLMDTILNFNPVPITASVNVSNIDCNPGAAELIINSGTPPFYIEWSASNSDSSWISISNPGVYEVEITDAYLCQYISQFNVSVDSLSIISVIDSISTDPCDSTLGEINIQVVSGIGPFTFQWSTGDTSQSLTNLIPGIYEVTVNGANSCTDDWSFEIPSPLPLSHSISVIISGCNSINASAEAIVSGGVMPYSYQWSTGDSINSINNLSSINYTISVSDYCGNQIIDSIFPVFPEPEIEIIANPLTVPCQGDTLLLAASFENTSSLGYLIDSLPLQLESTSGASITNYTMDRYYGPFPIGFTFSFFGEKVNQIYIGSNGWVSFSPMATIYDPWSVQAIPNSDPSRPRNAIFAAYKDWELNSSSSIKYKTVGTYPNRKLIVSYNSLTAYLCPNLSASFQIVLHEFGSLIDLNFINVPNCTSWNNGKGVSGIQNACGTVAYYLPELNYTQWTASNYTLRYTPDVNWYDSNLNLVYIGQPVTYIADNPGYVYAVIPNSPDSIIDSLLIVTPSYYPGVELGNYDTLCVGEYFGVIPDSSFSYLWNTGETTPEIIINESNTYSLTVSNGLCASTDSVNLHVNVFDLEFAYDSSYCSIDSTYISLNPEYEYLWSDGSSANYYSIDSAGIYVITVSDGICMYEIPLEIDLANYPISQLLDTLQVCGSYTILDPGEALNFSWSNGYTGQQMLINQTSLYVVTLTNAICETVDTVEVFFYPPVFPDLGPDTLVCYGTIIQLNPGNFEHYLWQNGLQVPEIAISQPDTYWVSVSNAYGCTGVDSLVYDVIYNPISDFSFDETYGTVQFHNESQFATDYSWNFGDGSPVISEVHPIHSYPSLPNDAYYTVTLIANNECGSDTAGFELIIFDIEDIGVIPKVKVYPNPFIDEFVIDGLKSDETIKIFDILGKELNYEIDKSQGKIILKSIKSGIYILKVTREDKTGNYEIIKK